MDSPSDLQSNLLVTPFDSQVRIATLERELAWAHLKIQSLTEQLRQQRVKFLGPRSETLSDLQLALLADEEPSTTLDEVEAEARRAGFTDAPPRQLRAHPGRTVGEELLEPTGIYVRAVLALLEACDVHGLANISGGGLPENLPRVEEVVRCSEQTCRQCGVATTVIGYDESEQLDVEPARYFVRVIRREKRA